METKRKQTKLNERALTNVLVERLKETTLGKIHIHVDRDIGALRSKSGFDFVIIFNGQTMFCEAKVENGKLTPFQLETKRRIEWAGGNYAVVRYRNIKSLTDFGIEIEKTLSIVFAYPKNVSPLNFFTHLR